MRHHRIGSRRFRLKQKFSWLEEMGIPYEDVGCDCPDSVDYPDYALPVAER